MKINTKLTLTTLYAALLPLIIAMMVSLWHSTEQLERLTLDSAQGYLRAGAEKLSGYFGQRISENYTYANSPLVRSMDWQKLGPFLKTELKRYRGTYEKLLIGLPNSSFYVTSGGNPAYKGLASFDNLDPKAKLKSIARRKYWQYLVGENLKAEARTYVSDPMVSYTTGVRQVLVGATVLSAPDNKVLGMIGGTIQWEEIESRIHQVHNEILKDFGRSVKLCLVTQSGVYIYHWNPDKVIHLKLDAQGNPLLNDIGEKVTVKLKITDESSRKLARAGSEMIRGREGFAFFTDPESSQKMAVIYAPVHSANYSMAMVIPKTQIMAPVKNLRWFFAVITLVSIVFVTAGSLLLSKKVTRPIEALNMAVKELARGNRPTKVMPQSSDEVGELAIAFNEMADSLEKREIALRESEEKYRTILESIENGYFEVDLSGSFIFFNDFLCTILGYSRDELDGMNKKQFTVQDNAKKLDQTFNEVYITGKPAKGIDWEIIRKNGDKRYLEFSISLMKDGKGRPIGFRGIVQDITGKKQIESELVQTKTFLQNIFDSSADGIMTTDLQGKIEFASPAAAHIFGADMEKLAGKKVFSFYRNGIEDARIIMRELTEQGTLKEHGMELIKKDGKPVNINLSASLLKDERGETIGTLGIFRDTTDKLRMESQLQQAKKMEAIGTLAGGVAHDLNNILSGLVSYPELLLMDLAQDSPIRKPVLTIKKSGEKAAAIVQDLLTLARRGVTVREVLNLNQIISEYLINPEHESLKMFHPDIEVQTDFETNLLKILGSPVHLSKTVMNLISNAAEAMPNGGKIIIKTENCYIDRAVRGYDNIEQGDYVVLTVSDNGVGISSEDMERIFEPFYTKKIMGRSGTGLGMAVVWGTVKDHKGYIDVHSIEGQGTTFTLYFPATRKETKKDAPLFTVENFTGSGESILVIDDVPEQREIASGMLSKLGYAVTAVSSGEKAVEMLETTSVDLLILDMIMDPGIDGLETYKKILELHPKQKAVIASGFSETDRVKQAQNLGAGQYMKKPYTLEKLAVVVRDELSK